MFALSVANHQTAAITAIIALSLVVSPRWNIDNSAKAEIEFSVFWNMWTLFALPVHAALFGFSFDLSMLVELGVADTFQCIGIVLVSLLVRTIITMSVSFWLGLPLSGRFYAAIIVILRGPLQAILYLQVIQSLTSFGGNRQGLMFKTTILVTSFFAPILASGSLHLLHHFGFDTRKLQQKREEITPKDKSLCCFSIQWH
ncbi:hypothetical protein AB6A40_003264 [Gnathostoma spinigerum]|uniref:PIN-like protein n=1 Tax=Gnathostoma spinigerum TaxID=75299 RepID=A0ABD6EA79_9BILA